MSPLGVLIKKFQRRLEYTVIEYSSRINASTLTFAWNSVQCCTCHNTHKLWTFEFKLWEHSSVIHRQ